MFALEPDASDEWSDERFEPRHDSALSGEPIADLARNDNLITPAMKSFTKQPLTFALAVHIGRVEERDTEIKGPVEGTHHIGLVHIAKDTTEPSATETDF
jgi:hypothetical protein